MKKVIITCALLTVGSMVSFAQTTAPTPAATPNSAQPMRASNAMPMTPEQRADRMTKRDEQMYTLTPEQSKAVYNVELDLAKTIEQMRAEHKQPAPEDRQKIMADRDAKMKAILTPEQYAKYSAGRSRPAAQPMTPATQPQQAK